MKIGNAFSLQMLTTLPARVNIGTIPKHCVAEAAKQGTLESVIGHADTVTIVNKDLGSNLTVNRVNTKLAKGELMVIAQFMGGRLPEGATSLPEGVSLVYLLVSVEYPD